MAQREYKKEIYDRIKEYLDSQDWKYDEAEDRGYIGFGIGVNNKLKGIDMRIFVTKFGFVCRAVSRIAADADSIGAALVFCLHANNGLSYGNFEVDPDDYEISYRCSEYCGDSVPSLDVAEFVVETPMMMFNRYGNALVESVVGGLDPMEAVKRAEAD